MTFSYTLNNNTFTDLEKVRFYTGDTVEGEHFLEDEEIRALITLEGTWQKATIAGIQQIIRRLSQPNFRADWLQVDYATARAGYEKMLNEVRVQLGQNTITGTALPTYRADSRQTEAPDFSSGTGEDDEGDQITIVVINP